MKKLCLLLAVLITNGCAHLPADRSKEESPAAGRELSADLASATIIKGKTTRKEILAKLGSPNSVVKNSRRTSQDTEIAEFWNYWTAPPMEAMGKSGSLRIFRLTISFDDNGVAVDYRTAQSAINLP